jgi:phage gp36-like protein
VPYSDQAAVQLAIGGPDRLTQQFDWTRDGTQVAANVTDCIAEADAIIDSFAGKRYKVPFATPTVMVRQVSARLAILCSARRRGLLTMDQQRELEQLMGTETGKEGWLYRLATGVVTIGGDPPPPKSDSMIVDQVDTDLPADRTVSRDKLGGYW